jgi:hypothetical protein
VLARPSGDAARDTEKLALLAILHGLERLDSGKTGMTVKEIIERLYPADRGPRPPDGFDDLREAIEALTRPLPGKPPATQKLGYQLRHFRSRVVAGRKLVGREDRNGTQKWAVETAGDEGDEGNVSVPRAGDGRTVCRPGGETYPSSPSSPAARVVSS